ncbi:hypothetical protein KKD52_07975 [Myxococcota bacterium]|nr:hypothetical protein [Myxococcota bacterium]MBU1510287.1 hypothetical protein [Myxococcota bacterium]
MQLRNRILSPIIALCFVFPLIYANCDALKGYELKLSADPSEIPAGGYEYSTITATLKKSNKPAKNGSITFETTNGSFSATEELDETTVATDDAGLATVKLYSARTPGAAVVTANYYNDETGETATSTINVNFGEPNSSSLPIASAFQLNCNYVNVGGLISPKPDVWVPCQISARNRNGNVIPPESMTMTFQAEAGELSGGTDSYGAYGVTYKVRGGNALPADVSPLSGEPDRACGGLTCNPRDGLVTLMVVTRGAESFTDRNGNNTYDDGEPFDDTPEPFLDVNDNGSYDNEEWFFDSNGDGQWTDANGRYDDDTRISAIFKIIWSGKPEENETASAITYSPASTSLPQSGTLTVSVRLVDKNLNPVAAFADPGDVLELTEHFYSLTPTQPSSYPGVFNLSNISGLELDQDWRFLSFDETASKFSCVFVDASPASTEPSDWRLGVGAMLSPGPEGEYGEFTQYEFSFSSQISGTIQ